MPHMQPNERSVHSPEPRHMQRSDSPTELPHA
nr:MAG TPA: hypothetical protein [Caudoviricetes sp.]